MAHEKKCQNISIQQSSHPRPAKKSMKRAEKKKNRRELVVEMNPDDPLKIIIRRIKCKRTKVDPATRAAYNDSGSKDSNIKLANSNLQQRYDDNVRTQLDRFTPFII